MGLDAKLVTSLAYTFATGADLRLAEAAAHRRGLGDTLEPYRKTVKTDPYGKTVKTDGEWNYRKFDRSTISARRRIACLPAREPRRVRFA
jgi:hypothetical protein